jgi:hypothetical protein
MSAPDFIARSQDGKTLLLIEVKNRPGMSPSWAANLRRNYLAHFGLPAAFLLATPDKFFWWLRPVSGADPVDPDIVIDAKPVLRPYISAAGLEDGKLSELVFESAVWSWLRELTLGLPGAKDVYPKQLLESDVFRALPNAVIS